FGIVIELLAIRRHAFHGRIIHKLKIQGQGSEEGLGYDQPRAPLAHQVFCHEAFSFSSLRSYPKLADILGEGWRLFKPPPIISTSTKISERLLDRLLRFRP